MSCDIFMVMKLDEVKNKYKNKWVLAKVTEQDKDGQPKEVEPIAEAKSQKAINKKLASCQDTYVTVIYTGKPKARIWERV